MKLLSNKFESNILPFSVSLGVSTSRKLCLNDRYISYVLSCAVMFMYQINDMYSRVEKNIYTLEWTTVCERKLAYNFSIGVKCRHICTL